MSEPLLAYDISKRRRSKNNIITPPRPPNAWILYRSDKMREIQRDRQSSSSSSSKEQQNQISISSLSNNSDLLLNDSFVGGGGGEENLLSNGPNNSGGTGGGGSGGGANCLQAQISRTVSQMWKNESQEVKEYYSQLAAQHKAKHQQQYPTYRYQPRRRSRKFENSEGNSNNQQQSRDDSTFQHQQQPVINLYDPSGRGKRPVLQWLQDDQRSQNNVYSNSPVDESPIGYNHHQQQQQIPYNSISTGFLPNRNNSLPSMSSTGNDERHHFLTNLNNRQHQHGNFDGLTHSSVSPNNTISSSQQQQNNQFPFQQQSFSILGNHATSGSNHSSSSIGEIHHSPEQSIHLSLNNLHQQYHNPSHQSSQIDSLTTPRSQLVGSSSSTSGSTSTSNQKMMWNQNDRFKNVSHSPIHHQNQSQQDFHQQQQYGNFQQTSSYNHHHHNHHQNQSHSHHHPQQFQQHPISPNPMRSLSLSDQGMAAGTTTTTTPTATTTTTTNLGHYPLSLMEQPSTTGSTSTFWHDPNVVSPAIPTGLPSSHPFDSINQSKRQY